MSITYEGSTAFAFSSPTVRGGTTWEAGNRALIIVSNSNALVQFDLTTMAQVGSGTTLSNPAQVALIDASSAVITSFGGSTVDFYELSSNTRSNVSGGITGTTSTSCLATDTTNKIGLYVNGGGRSIGRINGNTFTVTNFTFLPASTTASVGYLTGIVFIGNGRWIVADAMGNLYEIDSVGNMYKQYMLNLGSAQLSQGFLGNNINIFPRNMAYADNLLLVQTDSGYLNIVDWTTGTTIWHYQCAANSRYALSDVASGVCIAYNASNATNPVGCIVELDLAVKPGSIISELYLQSTGAVVDTGFSSLNSRGWFVYDTNPSTTIRFFSLAGERVTTTRTFTAQVGGIDTQARLMLLENGALGRPILDTYMQSPATYRVPTGKNIIELVQVGEGETATFDVSLYST